MALERIIYIFLVIRCVFGIVIDPQNAQTAPSVHVHCLASNDIIQIKDPFRPSQFNDAKFVAMEWYQYSDNGTKEVQLLEFMKNMKTPTTFFPRFTVFEFWGLQINNVELNDSATYKAKLVHLSQNVEWSVQITVVSPPQLQSERLSMSRVVNEIDHSLTTLKCGQVTSLGSPPVSIMLKAENGTVLPAVYRNGYMERTLASKEAETETFTCELDDSAPAAKCILDQDLPRWKVAFTEASTSQSAGSDVIPIIAGVVGGVVLLIIIIIIIIIIVLKRRKMKSKTYNAKEHEKKRGDEVNHENEAPLVMDYENPYDKPYVARSPIYKGPTAPSPYMVSRLSKGNLDPDLQNADSEYEEMGYANGDKSPPRAKFFKKGEDKDRKKTEKSGNKENNNVKEGVKEKQAKEEQKPPRAKPRSIFLTPSMEELDKINKAVAGGEGSGAAPVHGTPV